MAPLVVIQKRTMAAGHVVYAYWIVRAAADRRRLGSVHEVALDDYRAACGHREDGLSHWTTERAGDHRQAAWLLYQHRLRAHPERSEP